MKTVLNILKRPAELTTHLTICLSLWLLTLCVVDRFNGAMNFIGNNLTERYVLACTVIFVYQTVVCVFSYAKKKSALPCLALSLICSMIAVYLFYVCITDLSSTGRPQILKELNKNLLLIYSVISVISSVIAIVIQRKSKRAFNRNIKVLKSTNKS